MVSILMLVNSRKDEENNPNLNEPSEIGTCVEIQQITAHHLPTCMLELVVYYSLQCLY
jgi:Lon protease-like protein